MLYVFALRLVGSLISKPGWLLIFGCVLSKNYI